MTKRMIASAAILGGLLTAVTIGVIVVFPRSHSSRSASSAVPTSLLGIANTLDAAIYQADLFIASAPPLVSAHPSSFNYVQTTLGRARALFPLNIRYFGQPDWSGQGRVTPYADSALVWAFVAHGRFVSNDRLYGTTSTYSTAWIVIAEGEPGVFGTYDNARYDLTGLGKTQQVPGPIPTVTSLYDLTMTPPLVDTPSPDGR